MSLLRREPFPTYDLTFQDVLDILKLIDASPVEELELELADLRVKVSRRLGPAPAKDVAPPPVATESSTFEHPATKAEAAPAPRPSLAQPVAGTAADLPGGVAVLPPMAGTFYVASGPGAAPFVDVGSVVKSGDQVGIVEVMKLFTPVLAPCAGTVRAILVANEEFVRSDQTLMIVEPTE